MKCVAGHQPNAYPYGGFFAKADYVDEFVIVDVTQYVRKEYHNRNRIKLLDGKAHWLTIPVLTSGNYGDSIREIRIDNTKKWRRKHRRTLELNYAKAPYFEIYYPEIKDLLDAEWEFLAEYNTALIDLCFRLLGIKTKYSIASEIGIEGSATELIVDICRKTGADTYLHGMHSRDYVDFNVMKNAGIKSMVQSFRSLEYTQTSTPSQYVHSRYPLQLRKKKYGYYQKWKLLAADLNPVACRGDISVIPKIS